MEFVVGWSLMTGKKMRPITILKSGDKEEVVKADSAILAVGYTSQKELFEEIRFDVLEVHLLGDARQVQNIMYAIWDAYEVARNI
ncbi:hypothetical protein [Neobacillus drentensis]|uniref:hypothetical protein n=1 Tax=Neobacillus drentensis TaxID=220684 RepID=UPI002FFDC83B